MSFKNILYLIIFIHSTFYILHSSAEPAYAAEALYYIHQDHLGSTSMVTDEQGNVISKQVYYPYGSTRHRPLSMIHDPSRQYTSQISDLT